MFFASTALSFFPSVSDAFYQILAFEPMSSNTMFLTGVNGSGAVTYQGVLSDRQGLQVLRVEACTIAAFVIEHFPFRDNPY